METQKEVYVKDVAELWQHVVLTVVIMWII